MLDVIIIGAGIVGLSTAHQLLKKNPNLKIKIIEKEKDVALHQTGNNSGVIHSGIYYKPSSLKAKNCIRGYHMLLDFVREENIPHDICGKVIVATDKSELQALENIYNRGIENGLDGIKYINQSELKEIEPYLNGIKGIKVPQTGIMDYKAMSLRLKEILLEKGAEIEFDNRVIEINLNGRHIIKTDKREFESRFLINCAGLYSDKIARLSGHSPNIKIVPFRGEYYKLKEDRKHLVKHLIYPVPDPAFPFLGVHFTRMIDGNIEAGPNAVLAFAREGYKKSDIDLPELLETLAWPGFQKVAFKYWKTGMGEMHRSFSKSAFTKALQKLIPEIKEKDLIPGGAGVRAQACDKNGGLIDDFVILESKGILNVCNAPSPAATSSLSIGDTIADKLIDQMN